MHWPALLQAKQLGSTVEQLTHEAPVGVWKVVSQVRQRGVPVTKLGEHELQLVMTEEQRAQLVMVLG